MTDSFSQAENIRRHSNITSDRVEGTAVYAADGDKIGHVRLLVIEKVGGRVTDIVVSIGGFLGMGGELHSIPWSKFSYDLDLGGYRLNLSKEQLEKAPTFTEDDHGPALDPEYQQRVYEYYAVTPYWH